uniref:Glycosyltransferase RgtA/B/C/D-like domain-containing protein n=1 Tax=Geobacter sp. (strain M21) TaxID=443144 RepID=C6E5V4_GEOSM
MHDDRHPLTLREYGATVAMLLLGMYFIPLSVMHLDLSRIPGDLVDSRLNNYFLEHGYRWVTGQVASFWNAPFFFPAPQVMTLSDNHLGTLPLYSLFRLLNFDRETAYQLWMLTLFVLNYLCAVVVLNLMRFNPVGAAAGGYFFTFSLPMSAQLGHIQLLPRFMIPLAFYFVLRFLQQKRNRDLAAACACVVMQFYCVIYIGYFLSLGLAFFFASYLILAWDRMEIRAILWGSRKEFSERALALVGSGAALMPLMYPYYLRSIYSEPISWDVISSMLPRAYSYFYTFNESLMWSWLSGLGNALPMAHEHRLFVGLLPLLALMLPPLLWIRSPDWRLTLMGKLFLLTLLGTTLFTFYVDGVSLYRLIYWAPGVNAIRAPVRIILMQSFLVAVMVALATTFMASLLKDRPEWAKIILAGALLILMVCDQGLVRTYKLSYDKSAAQSRARALEELVLARDPKAKLFLYLPSNPLEERAERNLDAMLAAQHMGIYTVNGHSGYEPRDNRPDPRKPNYCSHLREWFVSAKANYRELDNVDLLDHLLIVGDLSCIGGGAD